MIFSNPLALLGLLSVGGLVAIYFFRRHHQRRVVSALFLWIDANRPHGGGPTRERLRVPPPFFLELLALVALALAAAGPLWVGPSAKRPLIVVLDDSFSMRAGTSSTPRSRGFEELRKIASKREFERVELIVAGEQPETIGRWAASEKTIPGWSCASSRSDLDSAIALALETGDADSRVLVITDHAPPAPPTDSRVEWRSFGRAASNIAIVNARRTSSDTGERILVEVANHSPAAATAAIRTTIGRSSNNSSIALKGGETRQLFLTYPSTEADFVAELASDELTADNKVQLVAAASRRIRTQLAVNDPILRELVDRALRATNRVLIADSRPDLVITDGKAPRGTWGLEIIGGAAPKAYAGPFIINRSHPLAAGLSLEGVVWGAASAPVPGDPVLMVGNETLVSDSVDAAGTHLLRMRFAPAMATLQRSTDWPALFWNLLTWRGSAARGFAEPNIPAGSAATLRLDLGEHRLRIDSPSASSRTMTTTDSTIAITAREEGIWTVSEGAQKYRFAANVMNRDESNLQSASTGRWGRWSSAENPRKSAEDWTWVFAAIAGVALAAHLALIAREKYA